MTEVRRSVLVNVGADHAFKAFTELEPFHGGHWHETGSDAPAWGSVLEREPPSRLLLAWHLDGDWDYDPDPARASEVEITFTPESAGTRVELVHRGPEAVIEGVSREGGWCGILLGYAQSFV